MTNNIGTKIGVIGLGYVGLPLACLFAKKYTVVGYEMSRKRVEELSHANDISGSISHEELDRYLKGNLSVTDDIEMLRPCNVYIVAVPTPVNENNQPDMRCLDSASRAVGKVISSGNVVVYESTVYPGATEDFCAPIIEEVSGLRLDKDFALGYSPERINPGDIKHKVEDICKIVSGSTQEAADRINTLYSSVLTGGTYKASSIKVAEAAKIMENTQRDVNIALMNEMARIFNAIGINTNEVIDAASTKWNFAPYHPGLVGGHCIGVDPYYLIQCANEHGVTPSLIKTARATNEAMADYIASQTMDEMKRRGINISTSNVLIMGFTFKEDCSDIRNTKVEKIRQAFCNSNANVTVYDPCANKDKVAHEYGFDIASKETDFQGKTFDAIIGCVKHSCFKSVDIKALMSDPCVIYDVKGFIETKENKLQL
ncbi:MAG: nucleotide sugar dehydrogenase [Prevotella sp.]